MSCDQAGSTTSSTDVAVTARISHRSSAAVRIQNGTMPTGMVCSGNAGSDAGKAACLTAAEQATLQAWIAGGQLP